MIVSICECEYEESNVWTITLCGLSYIHLSQRMAEHIQPGRPQADDTQSRDDETGRTHSARCIVQLHHLLWDLPAVLQSIGPHRVLVRLRIVSPEAVLCSWEERLIQSKPLGVIPRVHDGFTCMQASRFI